VNKRNECFSTPSDQITIFLFQLVNDLQVTVKNLPHACSHFTGSYSINSTSKDDLVEYDTKTINGIISLKNQKKQQKQQFQNKFFLFL